MEEIVLFELRKLWKRLKCYYYYVALISQIGHFPKYVKCLQTLFNFFQSCQTRYYGKMLLNEIKLYGLSIESIKLNKFSFNKIMYLFNN